MNPMQQRMMDKHYPYCVCMIDDPVQDVKIFEWMLSHNSRAYDFWDKDIKRRRYCFKKASEAVLFKLTWGGA